MNQQFDITKFKNATHDTNRYERHMQALAKKGLQIDCIEAAVTNSLNNITQKGNRSFVIYGEPQSGKTGMMIALTAKLLDKGYPIIVHLLNDNVDLLEQNLDRFQRSGLAPAPRSFHDILDPEIKIDGKEWVIFCKKNSKDLTKLIEKIGKEKNIIVIDDEADYATPNAKVNKGEKTKINALVEKLIGQTGIYIGVTATPARLDLNNTFSNDNELWVDFPPHKLYAGQDVFFPLSETGTFGKPKFLLNPLPDKQDSPKHLKDAFLRFCIHVAYLNCMRNKDEKTYSFLIHTSGIKADHHIDRKVIDKILEEMSDQTGKPYEAMVKYMWEYAHKLDGNEATADQLTKYVVSNISRSNVIVMNSNRQKDSNFKGATEPAALFTIVIGGNIVSRGVTFERMVGMFFTRDVKHKIQQDTYVQRARMFGNRGNELPYIELTIPQDLYSDWHRCFVFHRLSLAAIKQKKGSPVWLGDNRIAAVSSNSIDKTTVDIDRGEMSFGLFKYDKSYDLITSEHVHDGFKAMEILAERLGESAFPPYLSEFIKTLCGNSKQQIAIHPPASIAGMSDANQDTIERKKGFIGNPQLQKALYPQALHHLKIYFNEAGDGRLFYKFEGNITFAKNMRKNAAAGIYKQDDAA